MKKKESTETLASSFFDSKNKKIGAIAILAAVILLSAVLILLESSYGKWIIKNKTDLKLEYVKTSFVNSEDTVAKGIETDGIKADSTYKSKLKKINLLNSESNIEVRFKFENSKEMFTDVGYFNDNFDGNVTISFQKTADPNLIKFKVKASNGIFQTQTVDCNDVFTIDLRKGSILE